MAFGQNLYYLRKRDGITQEDLAEKLSVSRQSVSKWETGDAYPETEKIIVLCDMFNVTMDQLVRGDVSHAKTLQQPQTQQSATLDSAVSVSVDDDKVSVTTAIEDDVCEDDEDEDDDDEPNDGSRRWKIKKVLHGITTPIILVAYLLIGTLDDLWHPGWILFVAIPLINCLIDVVFAKDLKSALEKLIGVVSVATPVVYLVLGFEHGLWHPGWLIFFLIPITGAILGPIAKAVGKK